MHKAVGCAYFLMQSLYAYMRMMQTAAHWSFRLVWLEV